MRIQPKESNLHQPTRVTAGEPQRMNVGTRLASAAMLGVPFQGDGFAVMPMESGSMFTVILAALAGVLGLSASLLYRHMHRREEELNRRAADAEAELRALLMITDEAVLVLSADGNVRAANPAAEELFGRSADDFIGEALVEIFAQPLALGELTKHGPVNFETTAKHGEAGFTQVEMLLSPVELSGGRGYLAVVHEARKAVSADTTKQTAESAELRGAVTKFTHDLNNQLTAVLGNLSLILMARPGDPKTHERVLTAKRTAMRAQALGEQMHALMNPDGSEHIPTTTTQQIPATPDMNCTILPMPHLNAAAKRMPDPIPGPSRILILDDEEAICMLVSSVLDAAGFEVTTATSVADALRLCGEAMQTAAPFSLVICDLSLPGDADGITALKQLHMIDPNLKSIVSSGYDSDPVMRDCRKFGFTAAMAKPYDVNRLVRTVGNVLADDGAGLLKTA